MLVERSARGVRLTEAGEAVVRHAEGILARLAEAEAELEAIAGLRGGRLRLAAFASAAATSSPLAIAGVLQRHPAVELSLILPEPEDALPSWSGELDSRWCSSTTRFSNSVYEPSYDGLELRPLLEDQMHVTLPGHPLARRARIRLEDLSTEAWVQGDCEGLCGAMHVAACKSAGFEPRVGFPSDNYNVVQGLVAAGVAIS